MAVAAAAVGAVSPPTSVNAAVVPAAPETTASTSIMITLLAEVTEAALVPALAAAMDAAPAPALAEAVATKATISF